MSDDKFRVWGFRDEMPDDAEIRETYGFNAGNAGVGSADPSAIDIWGHQRNFEDAIAAFQAGRAPSVDGREARRAVALIEEIYAAAGKNA